MAHDHQVDPDRAEQATSDRLSDFCADQLAQFEQLNRRRSVTPYPREGKYIYVDGQQCLNLASNDYLAMSQHPKLIEAAVEATQAFGVGSGASRLVSGTQPIHDRIEQQFAAFKHAEACLLLATGYTANLAVLTSLAGPGDRIVLDKLVHASLIDAARASGAQVRTFPHLKLDRAEQLLKEHQGGRRILVSDSVFSMDGDCADLPALCDLADRMDAVLVVDEAHATGVLGQTGAGLAEHQGVAERVYHAGVGGVVICTASKALGSLGGLITGDQAVIDLIVNKARPFIYSTAVPPAQAAAIGAALTVVQDEPDHRRRLEKLSLQVRHSLHAAGWPIDTDAQPTPIIPLIVGDDKDALDLAKRLIEQGIFAPAIRPPTVAPGSARVRLTLRCDLAKHDTEHLLTAMGRRKQV